MVVNKIKSGRSVFRFSFVGGLNTAVDFLVFTILKEFFVINYLWCQIAAYSAGVINSFICNKVWTFESKTSEIPTCIQFLKFLLVNLVSMGISVVGLKLLSQNGNINVYISKVVVTIMTQAVNYCGYRFWVFQPIQVRPNNHSILLRNIFDK